MVRLTFLGTSDAFNGAGRAHSCYWVEDPQGCYVVDFGPTALLRCRELGLDPDRLDAVYLTHLHGDHIGGLAVLFIDLWFQRKRTRPLLIAGPPGTEARVHALLMSAYPSLMKKVCPYALEFLEWPVPGETTLGRRHIKTIRARHDTHSIASSLRIALEGAPVLAFSGDTGWQPELWALASDAAAFVCECSGVEIGFWGHLSLEEIRAHRATLTADRIFLTHLGDQSRAAADAAAAELNVEVADDGLVVTLE